MTRDTAVRPQFSDTVAVGIDNGTLYRSLILLLPFSRMYPFAVFTRERVGLKKRTNILALGTVYSVRGSRIWVPNENDT